MKSVDTKFRINRCSFENNESLNLITNNVYTHKGFAVISLKRTLSHP